jgi:SET domain-containing protein
VYIGCKTNQIHAEPIICNCVELDNDHYGCIRNCLNRITFTECNIEHCNLKEKCFNQRIQKREWVESLEIFETGDKRGNGVRAFETIERGKFIIEYVGEVIKKDEFKNRMKNVYKNEVNHYTLSLHSGLVIDSYRIGSLARFINHSCEPNCEVQKWLVNGQYRMCIFASCNILRGTELTYNYKFHAFNSKNMVCFCF